MEAGYLGVGAMGQPMVHKLLDAGHVLTIYVAAARVWTRSKQPWITFAEGDQIFEAQPPA